jgi:hypothetical protein
LRLTSSEADSAAAPIPAATATQWGGRELASWLRGPAGSASQDMQGAHSVHPLRFLLLSCASTVYNEL